MNNGAAGFPDGSSSCSKCVGDQCDSCSKSMEYSPAFDDSSCGYDCEVNGEWKQGVYTRTHRDQQIINSMRGWMGLSQEEDPAMLGLGPHCAAGGAKSEEFLQ